MKTSLLILIAFFLVPEMGVSQTTKNSISLIGGAEYQNSETTGWNIEFNYDRQLNSSRFYTEFGLNYSILEYNRANKVELYDGCGPWPQVAFGTFPNAVDGYYYSTIVQYEKRQYVRLQAGINYKFVDKPKLSLSGGLNFVNQALVGKYTHGQYVIRPADCEDSLSTRRGTFASKSQHLSDKLSIQLQPHMDVSVNLSSNILLVSRLSYYWQVQPRLEHSRIQLNVGLKYQW